MPLALDQKVGAVVWSPLGWGRLTGKIRRGQPLPEDSRLQQDRRRYGRRCADEYLYRVVDALDAIAKETGKTRAADRAQLAAAAADGRERRSSARATSSSCARTSAPSAGTSRAEQVATLDAASAVDAGLSVLAPARRSRIATRRRCKRGGSRGAAAPPYSYRKRPHRIDPRGAVGGKKPAASATSVSAAAGREHAGVVELQIEQERPAGRPATRRGQADRAADQHHQRDLAQHHPRARARASRRAPCAGRSRACAAPPCRRARRRARSPPAASPASRTPPSARR